MKHSFCVFLIFLLPQLMVSGGMEKVSSLAVPPQEAHNQHAMPRLMIAGGNPPGRTLPCNVSNAPACRESPPSHTKFKATISERARVRATKAVVTINPPIRSSIHWFNLRAVSQQVISLITLVPL